jgi:hypothetical protein
MCHHRRHAHHHHVHYLFRHPIATAGCSRCVHRRPNLRSSLQCFESVIVDFFFKCTMAAMRVEAPHPGRGGRVGYPCAPLRLTVTLRPPLVRSPTVAGTSGITSLAQRRALDSGARSARRSPIKRSCHSTSSGASDGKLPGRRIGPHLENQVSRSDQTFRSTFENQVS